MRIQYKISLFIISIFLVLSLMLSSSYALWVFNVSQESTNVLVSDCFEITLTDNNPIGLSASFPMRDSDGVKTTPYTFTIKNICNHGANYSVNLETLATSTLDPTNVRMQFENKLYNYGDRGYATKNINEASSAIKLTNGTLLANQSKTYELKLWLKEDAIQSEVENKSFVAKVSVRAILNKDAFSPALALDGGTLDTQIALTKGETIGELPTPTKENYIFDGWYLDDTYSNKVNENTIVKDDNATLYAKWIDGSIIKYYLNSLVEKSNDLKIDNTEDKNIRYVSANANNYVYFNCSNDSDVSTCELWRIVGLFGDNAKIVKTNPVKTMKYTEDEDITNWGESLIYDYLNSNTQGNYYYSLTSNAKNMINNYNWNSGYYRKTTELYDTPLNIYNDEKLIKVQSNVGLLSNSDLLYTLPEEYWKMQYDDLYDTNTIFNLDVTDKTWLDFNNITWLINLAGLDYSPTVIITNKKLVLSTDYSGENQFQVVPAVYLNSNVRISNLDTADGSLSKPYRLTI